MALAGLVAQAERLSVDQIKQKTSQSYCQHCCIRCTSVLSDFECHVAHRAACRNKTGDIAPHTIGHAKIVVDLDATVMCRVHHSQRDDALDYAFH